MVNRPRVSFPPARGAPRQGEAGGRRADWTPGKQTAQETRPNTEDTWGARDGCRLGSEGWSHHVCLDAGHAHPTRPRETGALKVRPHTTDRTKTYTNQPAAAGDPTARGQQGPRDDRFTQKTLPDGSSWDTHGRTGTRPLQKSGKVLKMPGLASNLSES